MNRAIAFCGISLDRAARLNLFVSHIQSLPDSKVYDVIAIQELWDESDFLVLKNGLASIYPTAYYPTERHSLQTSGLAILSRHKLIEYETAYFPMNGKPERVDHGDWLCSKGILHVTLEHEATKRKMDIYTAHVSTS